MVFLQRLVLITAFVLILNTNVSNCKEIRFVGNQNYIGFNSQLYIAATGAALAEKGIVVASDPEKTYKISIDCYLPFISQRGGCLSTDPYRLQVPPVPKANPSIPRIAVLLPLTGKHSKIGQAMLNASKLALFHFADKQFELLPHDTQGTEKGALDAITLAIGDGASLILGPLLSSSVKAIAPAARAAGIRVIAFSSDRMIAGEGVFTMGFLPEEQVRRVSTFAISKGLRKFAVLAPDNEYGLTIVESLKETTESFGAEVVIDAVYSDQALDADLHPVIK